MGVVVGAFALSACPKPGAGPQPKPDSKPVETSGANADSSKAPLVLDLAALQDRLRMLEVSAPAKQWEVDATGAGKDSGFGVLRAFLDDQGAIRKVANVFTNEAGGTAGATWYFDKEDELVAASEVSILVREGGIQDYSEETKHYQSGALFASISRRGDFGKGAAVEVGRLEPFLTPATEIGEDGAVDIYLHDVRRGRNAGRIVRAFHGRAGGVPQRLLLETISPNARFLVQWDPRSPADEKSGMESATFSMLDAQTGKTAGQLNGAMAPGMNHIYHWAVWSPDSAWVIFAEDAKWTTASAVLHRVTPGGLAAAGLVHEAAAAAAWNHLKSVQHPHAKRGSGIHGFVRMFGLNPDGLADLVLVTESKDGEPGGTLRTRMELRPENGGGLLAANVRVLPETGEQESSAAEEGKQITISAVGVGPVTSDTPFALAALRDIFSKHHPGCRVEEGIETFEEGDEQPVFRVLLGDEILLTVAPIVGERRIGHLFTRSERVPTAGGVAAGTAFGEIFKEIPAGANFEGMTGEVTVAPPGMPNVLFRFAPADRNEGEGLSQLPPPAKLKDWKLDSIEWRPQAK